MKVRDVMTNMALRCRPEANLGLATELMWKGDCGFLPVVDHEQRVVGVVTDRDICIALGTRGVPAGDVRVAEVMSREVCFCSPGDDIHAALQTMRGGRVHRLPVLTDAGKLAGVISIDDILLRTNLLSSNETPEISSKEIIETAQAIDMQHLPQIGRKQRFIA